MTPDVIHFIYPVTERTRPFSYLNALAVRMAAKVQKPDRILFWTNAPPETIAYWDDIRDLVTVMPAAVPAEFRGQPIKWPQYAADVMRLQILLAHGGVYMDTDMLLLKPLREHMGDKLVLSWENPGQTSICNALMMSPPGNDFIAEWLDRLPAALKSDTWAFGGVVLPGLLARAQELEPTRTILPHTFCCPLDLSRQWLTDPGLADEAEQLCKNSSAIHIWETYWRDYVRHLDASHVATAGDLFSRIARKYAGK